VLDWAAVSQNQLGAKILSLAVLNDAGQFIGANIAEDASAMLKPVGDDAIRRINKLIMDNMPQEPSALAAGNRPRAAIAFEYQVYGRYGLQFRQNCLAPGRRSTDESGGIRRPPALDLPPRTYVAITGGPEVEVGISYARRSEPRDCGEMVSR
jgi:hypothetical protein